MAEESKAREETRPGRAPHRVVLATLRNYWRGLTTMRTALVLLFLLALASVPGALLPQRSVAPELVVDYYNDNPRLAPLLDRLSMFDVFGSVWFAAIYVLLFTSLVGCVVPRCAEFVRQLRARPVLTPRNLDRLPHHHRVETDVSPEEAVAHARTVLRGWRVAEREEDQGVRTLSAERGYLREAGNLVFHTAMLGLLVAFALGELFGYEGQTIVRADGQEFCNSGIYNYDSFNAGISVDGTNLNPFCVRVDGFRAEHLPTGQALQYHADLSYQVGDALETGEWSEHELQVNHPLRTGTDRVYLLGHGYAPRFTVTFPNGEERVKNTQWRPVELQTMLSEGATKFDPPGTPDEEERHRGQLAITGLLAPTPAYDGTLLTSRFPALNEPAVAVDVLRGNLGNDSGRGQSIFEIDQEMVDAGLLERAARENLSVGEELELDDGTVIRFDGVDDWVSLQVSHDPAQIWVLVASIAVLLGLSLSLGIKRRRVWVRATPADPDDPGGRTVVRIGGLARTDQAGYGEEFTRLAAELEPAGRSEPPADPEPASARAHGKDT
ncbi:cytochrome c biogenesis protein ResB [Actinoalloteichus caeruleus]|uniref:cytochrome c biogenesis protein ResB n=1 Tax=Actinoalloteichus cyanogriseus TaxID=2893586 RepID=UPI0004C1BAE6|nr:cytochrome c biogenesis protein ResB [Actinoalloteichus caeruleus]